MTSDLYGKVTALVAPPTAKCLRRVLKSRDRRCPELKLLVAGQQIGELAGVSWVATPEDAPLATRLNSLLARVTTPYCLVIPGAGQWQRRPRLEALLTPLREDRCDLVSGFAIECRRSWTLWARKVRRPHATLTVSGSAARLEPVDGPLVDGLSPCDVGSSYLAARTSELRRIGGWDDSLDPDEQTELYVRARGFQLRVAGAPAATLRVWLDRSASPPPLSEQTVAAMGFTEWTDLEGRQSRAAGLSMAA